MLARLRLLAPPLVLALGLAECTPSKTPGQPAAGDRVVAEATAPATTPAKATLAEVVDAAPSPPPAPATKLCSVDEGDGEPWGALSALLARSPVPESFHCPAAYRVAQRRPWSQDSLAPGRARKGEVFELVGEDPASGDVVLATLLRLDALTDRERAWEPDRLDELAYFIVLPEEPSRPLALAGPTLEEHRWYAERFAAREAATLAEPLRWLRERTTDEALDVVALTFGGDADDEDQAAILHHHAGTTVTICARARAREVRCWTRQAIRRSQLLEEGELAVQVEIEPAAGAPETWAIGEELQPRPASEIAAGTAERWTEATAPAPLAALISSQRRIRPLRPGTVAVGHYETIGHATIVRAPITDWILRKEGGRWTAIATPAMILDELVELGPALGVLERRQLVSEAGAADSLRLLAFAPAGDAWRFVGQLPRLVGERVHDPGGDFRWRHTIEVADPACVSLGPGPHDGVTFDPETDGETAIDARVRARFRAARERWTISADGWRQGCEPPRGRSR